MLCLEPGLLGKKKSKMLMERLQQKFIENAENVLEHTRKTVSVTPQRGMHTEKGSWNITEVLVPQKNSPPLDKLKRMEPVLIELEPWEYEHACDVGIRRYTANWNKQDAPHYANKKLQEDNRTAQVASAICELAVAKHTNRYWSGHVWHATEHQKYRHIPDVGKNIEVRRLRTRDEAAVRKHQNNIEKLVLWVAKPVMPELRQVHLYGWIKQTDAWQQGTTSDYDPENTKTIHINQLNTPHL